MNKPNKIENDVKFYDTYTIDLVHNYFYIFHAWVAHNKYQKSILSIMQISTSIFLILLVITCFYNFAKIFYEMSSNVLVFFITSLAIMWLIQAISLGLGFLTLSPNIKTIQKRMLDEFNIKTELSRQPTRINFYINKFELEKIWIKNVINSSENIDELSRKVSDSLEHLKPTSRDIENNINNILKNPYVTNSLVVIFTVSLTISLSPLIPTIDNENFPSMVLVLNLMAFNTWALIIILFCLIKFVFLVIELSFEYSISRKQFVLWRYEIFLDMLARHQQVKVYKPRIRYKPKL